MKVNTAFGLVLSGAALFIFGTRTTGRLQSVALGMALVVTVLGLATLGQYVFGWRLGIDEMLFRDNANAYNSAHGRMSPYSVATFCAIGVALALLPVARLQPLVWLMSALAILVGGLSLMGYVWGAPELITDRLLPRSPCTLRWSSRCWGSAPCLPSASGMPRPQRHSGHRRRSRPRWRPNSSARFWC